MLIKIMAVPLMGFLLFLLAMAGHSSAATYCLCKDGLSDSVLQTNIDYACGSGADCTPIIQGGSCYNPNTVKDHCNYAVNSYFQTGGRPCFQRKGQATGSCDFTGTATPSSNPPPPSGCVYPSSSSGGTPTTPGTGTGTGTPGTGTGTGMPGTGTGTGMPGTGTGTGTPGTGTGTGTGTTVPGGSASPFPGLDQPTGGINNPDGSGSGSLRQSSSLFYSLTLPFLFSVLMCSRV